MSNTAHVDPTRDAHLVSLLRSVDRQYARERNHHDGPHPLRGTREGQAPSTIDAPPKPKASPRLTTSARDISTGQHAPDRMRCTTCGDLARWVPIRPYGNRYAYWCGRNYSHTLAADEPRKPRTVATAKRQTVTGRTTTGNRHENLATQVWVPETDLQRAARKGTLSNNNAANSA